MASNIHSIDINTTSEPTLSEPPRVRVSPERLFHFQLLLDRKSKGWVFLHNWVVVTPTCHSKSSKLPFKTNQATKTRFHLDMLISKGKTYLKQDFMACQIVTFIIFKKQKDTVHAKSCFINNQNIIKSERRNLDI
jgi:hypothetical protein